MCVLPLLHTPSRHTCVLFCVRRHIGGRWQFDTEAMRVERIEVSDAVAQYTTQIGDYLDVLKYVQKTAAGNTQAAGGRRMCGARLISKPKCSDGFHPQCTAPCLEGFKFCGRHLNKTLAPEHVVADDTAVADVAPLSAEEAELQIRRALMERELDRTEHNDELE